MGVFPATRIHERKGTGTRCDEVTDVWSGRTEATLAGGGAGSEEATRREATRLLDMADLEVA